MASRGPAPAQWVSGWVTGRGAEGRRKEYRTGLLSFPFSLSPSSLSPSLSLLFPCPLLLLCHAPLPVPMTVKTQRCPPGDLVCSLRRRRIPHLYLSSSNYRQEQGSYFACQTFTSFTQRSFSACHCSKPFCKYALVLASPQPCPHSKDENAEAPRGSVYSSGVSPGSGSTLPALGHCWWLAVSAGLPHSEVEHGKGGCFAVTWSALQTKPVGFELSCAERV